MRYYKAYHQCDLPFQEGEGHDTNAPKYKDSDIHERQTKPGSEFSHCHIIQTYEIKRFISRTASTSPTMTARAIMLWPMFSSLIPSIVAIGRTLR